MDQLGFVCKSWGVRTMSLSTLRHTESRLYPQAFSQRGVRVSFGHPFAEFGHPNIHIFVYNAMGCKGIGHPIHPNVYFWTPNFEILAKALDTPESIVGDILYTCITWVLFILYFSFSYGKRTMFVDISWLRRVSFCVINISL